MFLSKTFQWVQFIATMTPLPPPPPGVLLFYFLFYFSSLFFSSIFCIVCINRVCLLVLAFLLFSFAPVVIQAYTQNRTRLTRRLLVPLGPLGNWALRHSALGLRGSVRRMTLRQPDTGVVRNPPSGGSKKNKKKAAPVAPAFITSLGSALVTNTRTCSPHGVTPPCCASRKRSSD